MSISCIFCSRLSLSRDGDLLYPFCTKANHIISFKQVLLRERDCTDGKPVNQKEMKSREGVRVLLEADRLKLLEDVK